MQLQEVTTRKLVKFQLLAKFPSSLWAMNKELLEPGGIYHIYNHAVGNDKLFVSEANYSYFLRRYHIHFLVEFKNEIDICAHSKCSTSQFISKQFSNLFGSYAQAFNKQQTRRGNLFISNFKRRKIESDEYLRNIIRYIHMNPVNHSCVKRPSQWRFSSFNTLCSDCATFLARDKVVGWFGGLKQFLEVHAVSHLPESSRLSGK